MVWVGAGAGCQLPDAGGPAVYYELREHILPFVARLGPLEAEGVLDVDALGARADEHLNPVAYRTDVVGLPEPLSRPSEYQASKTPHRNLGE